MTYWNMFGRCHEITRNQEMVRIFGKKTGFCLAGVERLKWTDQALSFPEPKMRQGKETNHASITPRTHRSSPFPEPRTGFTPLPRSPRRRAQWGAPDPGRPETAATGAHEPSEGGGQIRRPRRRRSSAARGWPAS
jgi:hypothetical protein